MLLTQQQIVSTASDILNEARALAKLVQAGMDKLNLHNTTKGATHVNTGPMSVALGTVNTAVEQLEKHVAENSPKDAQPPTPPGATQ